MVALFVVAVKHSVPVIVNAGLVVVANTALGAGLAISVVGVNHSGFVFHIVNIAYFTPKVKGVNRPPGYGKPPLLARNL